MPIDVNNAAATKEQPTEGKPRRKRASIPRATLNRATEQAGGAITNVFHAHNQSVKDELVKAKNNRDDLVEKASDALVVLLKETKPLIYARAVEKLYAEQEEDESAFSFGDASLFDDDFSDLFSTDHLLASTSVAGCLPM